MRAGAAPPPLPPSPDVVLSPSSGLGEGADAFPSSGQLPTPRPKPLTSSGDAAGWCFPCVFSSYLQPRSILCPLRPAFLRQLRAQVPVWVYDPLGACSRCSECSHSASRLPSVGQFASSSPPPPSPPLPSRSRRTAGVDEGSGAPGSSPPGEGGDSGPAGEGAPEASVLGIHARLLSGYTTYYDSTLQVWPRGLNSQGHGACALRVSLP